MIFEHSHPNQFLWLGVIYGWILLTVKSLFTAITLTVDNPLNLTFSRFPMMSKVPVVFRRILGYRIGSIVPIFFSGIPSFKFGMSWLKIFLIQTLSSGSLLLHGVMLGTSRIFWYFSITNSTNLKMIHDSYLPLE